MHACHWELIDMSQSTLNQLLIHSVSIETFVEYWLRIDGDLHVGQVLIEVSIWSSVSINTTTDTFGTHHPLKFYVKYSPSIWIWCKVSTALLSTISQITINLSKKILLVALLEECQSLSLHLINTILIINIHWTLFVG